MTLNFANAAKAKQLKEYFNRHGRIYIVVDATRDDVEVPEHLLGDPGLRLVLNLRMPQPIHIYDDRIESDLSFSGQIFPCLIPMHAVWAAYLPEGDLEQGLVWEESMPEMIKALMQAVTDSLSDEEIASVQHFTVRRDADKTEPTQHGTGRPGMLLIDGGASSAEHDKPSASDASKESPTDAKSSAVKRASHLRVVK